MNATFEEIRAALEQSNAAISEQLRKFEARLNRHEFGVGGNGPKFILPGPAELKAQVTGIDPAGGFIVTEAIGPFFDRLRAQAVVLQSGVRVLTLDQADRLSLPGLGGSATVQRAGEGSTITSSDLSFVKNTAVARKYIVRTVASSEWVADSNPSGRELVTDDHRKQLALQLDIDFLIGSSPVGILGMANWPSVNTVTLGAGNGATITLDNVEAMLYRLEAANSGLESLAIYCHPRTWSTLRKEKDAQNRYQLGPDPTREAQRQLFGVRVFTTSQIPINQTVGSSNDCSRVIAADVTQLVAARRLELGVLFDPYSKSETDQVVVQTQTRWGFAVLNAGGVEIVAGVRP